jgi:hypothetical protein
MKRARLDLDLLGAVIPAVADGGAFDELVGVGVVGFLLAAVPVDDFAGVAMARLPRRQKLGERHGVVEVAAADLVLLDGADEFELRLAFGDGLLDLQLRRLAAEESVIFVLGMRRGLPQ